MENDKLQELKVCNGANEDDLKKRRRFYLALIGVGISFIYVFCTTFVTIPESGQRIADTVLGMIITGILGQIYSYYFAGKEKEDNENKQKEEEIQ